MLSGALCFVCLRSALALLWPGTAGEPGNLPAYSNTPPCLKPSGSSRPDGRARGSAQGGARLDARHPPPLRPIGSDPVARRWRSRCCKIIWMTAGSSMAATIRTFPWQRSHCDTSIPNTRLSRCAQVIPRRRAAGVSGSSLAPRLGRWIPPRPRWPGVTSPRCALLGANRP
jgi:hypothetical protein